MKRRLFNGLTWIIGLVFLLALLSVDSNPALCLPVMGCCWLWLMWAAHVNGWLYEPERDEDDV